MYCVLEVSDQGYVEDISEKHSIKTFSKADFDEYVWKQHDFPHFSFELKLKIAREKKHSQLNDFLFYIDKGFVISQKVKDILTDYSLPPHQFYPATVIKNKKEYPYYYFYYFSDAVPFLDFSQCKLYFINELNEKISFNVNSLADFNQFKLANESIKESLTQLEDNKGMPKPGSLKETLALRRKIAWMYRAQELVFGKGFDQGMNLFRLSEFSWMCYVSKRLSQALQQAKVSGIILSEIAQRQYLVDRPNPIIKWS